MTLGVARLGDKVFGVCQKHGRQKGLIVSASPDTIVNDRGVARLGDKIKCDCGHDAIIVSASTDTIVNDRGVARLGDKVQGKFYKGIIISASPDTFVND